MKIAITGVSREEFVALVPTFERDTAEAYGVEKVYVTSVVEKSPPSRRRASFIATRSLLDSSSITVQYVVVVPDSAKQASVVSQAQTSAADIASIVQESAMEVLGIVLTVKADVERVNSEVYSRVDVAAAEEECCVAKGPDARAGEEAVAAAGAVGGLLALALAFAGYNTRRRRLEEEARASPNAVIEVVIREE